MTWNTSVHFCPSHLRCADCTEQTNLQFSLLHFILFRPRNVPKRVYSSVQLTSVALYRSCHLVETKNGFWSRL